MSKPKSGGPSCHALVSLATAATGPDPRIEEAVGENGCHQKGRKEPLWLQILMVFGEPGDLGFAKHGENSGFGDSDGKRWEQIYTSAESYI